MNHLALLQAMSVKGMPAYVVRVFADCWGKSHDMVLWRGKLSESFLVVSCVPHAGESIRGKVFKFANGLWVKYIVRSDIGVPY